MAGEIKIRDKVKSIAVKDLMKYSNNNKSHPESQIKVLKANIERFGFTTPLLVDSSNGEIVAGHGRAIAAEELGIKKVPYIDVSDLSEVERKALRVADNKISELAEWNKEELRVELGELNRDGMLELTGFQLSDLNVFTREKSTESTSSSAPEPEKDQYLTITSEDLPFLKSLLDHTLEILAENKGEVNAKLSMSEEVKKYMDSLSMGPSELDELMEEI